MKKLTILPGQLFLCEKVRLNLRSGKDNAAIFRSVIGSDIEIPCLLAMWLSLRISEVRGLKFKDISDDGKYISIRRT